MNVSNDAPPMDYLKYFTEQLPQDLARMTALRDELAIRQGALSAVELTVKDRKAAEQELAAAKAEAADILADAKKVSDEAKATLADLKAQKKQFAE